MKTTSKRRLHKQWRQPKNKDNLENEVDRKVIMTSKWKWPQKWRQMKNEYDHRNEIKRMKTTAKMKTISTM